MLRDITPSSGSPFFASTTIAEVDSLAILHLKRDSLVPVRLRNTAGADDGYAEGAVTNTRFGSFPHSTLIGLEWGSQVRASRVDTGSRGRKSKKAKQQETGADGNARLTEDAVAEGAATVEEAGDDVAAPASKKRKSDAAELYDGSEVTKKAKQTTVSMSKEAPGAIAPSDVPTGKKRKSDIVDLDEAQVPDKKSKQLPAETANGDQHTRASVKAPVEAGSGFIHLLQPTPESWTYSLDHRTQVVYTPDYSYILQRLRVHPGSSMIEAGAGSGSFTHAAARAVFSGYPSDLSPPSKKRKVGQVYSYEFHAPRVETLRQELNEHGLNGVVHLTHRDVCGEGFSHPGHPKSTASPNVNAVFLDLPAPWLALKHLTRTQPDSPLNPDTAVHLCTFSPCIEQVIATVSALRKAGWTEIQMVEVQNRRIDVRREQVGLKHEGLRGVNASAATVDEAVGRLREIEQKQGDFHASKSSEEDGQQANVGAQTYGKKAKANGKAVKKVETKQERLDRIKREAEERKLYKEGNLVHRTEPEVKTHTSYLVFAILPKEWTDEDERAALEAWPVDDIMKGEKADGAGKGANPQAKVV
ncbi:hypothetical protein LTR85_007778 [Meristemomyces frigidus]|nr:hypothetical protein LTR85_007778 [Meristemomyces frigidus]